MTTSRSFSIGLDLGKALLAHGFVTWRWHVPFIVTWDSNWEELLGYRYRWCSR